MHLVDRLAGQIGDSDKGRVSHFVLEAANWWLEQQTRTSPGRRLVNAS
jgi:hypothetical protein